MKRSFLIAALGGSYAAFAAMHAIHRLGTKSQAGGWIIGQGAVAWA